MIKISGNLLNNLKEIRYMIEYLTENYPLPDKTIVVLPVPQNTIKCNGADAWATIHLNSESTSPEIKVQLCTGPKRMEYPILVAQSLAHEYCHALQVYRDGKKYIGSRDEELEKEASKFAAVAFSKVSLRIIAERELNPIKIDATGGEATLKSNPYLMPSIEVSREIVNSSLKLDVNIEKSSDLTKRMKDTIDKFFNCSAGTEYRNVYYNSLIKCGLMPINPKTGKYYTIRYASNSPTDCSEDDLKVLRSINRFYDNVRKLTGERKAHVISEADIDKADTHLLIKVLRSRFMQNKEWNELLGTVDVLSRQLEI